MLLEKLREEVLCANLDLPKHGLVTFTWGNVSGIDRDSGLMGIKPSGVSYEAMRVTDMVVLNLQGEIVDGTLRPSSDTPTHLVLYRECPTIGGIVHTHSTHATAWAQAGIPIPIVGTTHADYFASDIPCTRNMTKSEVEGAYERETGTVIIEAFKHINPLHIPGVIVKNHGPFTWGKSSRDAVHNSVVLEEVAKMAFLAKTINPAMTMNPPLVTKHFERKHGAHAYYGQKKI